MQKPFPTPSHKEEGGIYTIITWNSQRNARKEKKNWLAGWNDLLQCYWAPSSYVLLLWSPTFLAPGTGFVEDNSSTDRGWGNGFRMIHGHYIYCALYIYYYYIVTYNEIIIQLTIIQNQWEPWACFHLPRTDRVLIWVCKQLIYYGLCAVKRLC